MTSTEDRSPTDWYAAAARSYVEDHQGCPWCRARQCVFRSERGERIEYYCSACDFSAGFDRDSRLHYFAEGSAGVSLADEAPEGSRAPGGANLLLG